MERLVADTPRTTAGGTSFVAPKDWKIAVRGAATLLELPEAGSRMALVDVDAKDADAAVEAAWAAYGAPRRKLKLFSDEPNREGWSDTRVYSYETSPNEQREVLAVARRSSGSRWTVVIEDVSVVAIDKRNAQRRLIHSSLLPKGFERESFAGKKARLLGPAEIAELKPDGTVSFRAMDAGIWGFGLEFVVDAGAKGALKLREGQHEYTFTAK